MQVTLTKIERVVIASLVAVKSDGQPRKENRSGTRLIGKLEDSFELSEVGVVNQGEFKDKGEYEFSDLEREWILDEIEKRFEKDGAPTNLGRHFLSLEDKLKELKEEESDA